MTMSTSLILATDEASWNRAMQQTTHDVYCSREWCLAASEIDTGIPALITAREGETYMVAPLIIRDFAAGVKDAVSPYGYAGPVFSQHADVGFRERAMQAAAMALAQFGAVTWFVRCHPILDPLPTAEPRELVQHGPTVSIDLTLDRDIRWSAMHSGHRYEIRRAVREGLEVAESASEEDWAQFRSLYESTMRGLDSRPYYLFSNAHWDRLVALGATGCAKLLIARIGSQIAGGAIFLYKPNTAIAHYHLSGTHEVFRRFQPSKLIIAAAQDKFAESGFSLLHLGGGVGARQDGLFDFKRGFSPLTHRFHSRRIVLKPEQCARLCKGGPCSLHRSFPCYRA
jgi:hypothetical protein